MIMGSIRSKVTQGRCTMVEMGVPWPSAPSSYKPHEELKTPLFYNPTQLYSLYKIYIF